MFFDHSFTQKRVLYQVGLQESTSMETCLSTHSLAMVLHVTIFNLFLKEELTNIFSAGYSDNSEELHAAPEP
jgi:hypothetical protein